MAKIKVFGDAAVLTSSLKMADIEKLNKFKPSALTVVDEDKEPVYRVKKGDKASFDSFGASFNSTNEAGYATATLPLPTGLTREAKKAYIADHYALAIVSLNEAETVINNAVSALASTISRAENAIEFIGEADTASETPTTRRNAAHD